MPTNTENGRRRARVIATVVAVLLACSGAAAVAVGIVSQDPAPPSPPSGQSATPPSDSSPASPKPKRSQPPDEPAKNAVEELGYSAPVHISIPKIDASSSLLELGLDSDGVMETPQPPNVDKAGWFRPSPPPGIPGATVIAGHVTWNEEPEVFFGLGDLRKGDKVEVERKDGITTVFRVYRIGSFPKDGFPTDAVYDRPDRSELRLITCGGEYDAANNRYLSNVIVWARIVDVVKA